MDESMSSPEAICHVLYCNHHYLANFTLHCTCIAFLSVEPIHKTMVLLTILDAKLSRINDRIMNSPWYFSNKFLWIFVNPHG